MQEFIFFNYYRLTYKKNWKEENKGKSLNEKERKKTWKYNFLRKKKILLVKLCFSLHFIPLDPDPDQRTQMNPDPHHS